MRAISKELERQTKPLIWRRCAELGVELSGSCVTPEDRLVR